MWSLSAWRRRRLLRRSRYTQLDWQAAFARLPLLAGLTPADRKRLRDLAIEFLHAKSMEPAAGLVLTDFMRMVIALQACLPILELGLDWYEGWSSVIVYPSGFVTEHEYVDDGGIVHRGRRELSGEAWSQGPVILSWSDAVAGALGDGTNLVIHEFAHKLDMLDGSANGRPPLHRTMDQSQWTASFSRAFDDMRARILRDDYAPIDDYAAESPAEFFAVMSEAFFETPDVVHQTYPEVYRQLREFYRQEPRPRALDAETW